MKVIYKIENIINNKIYIGSTINYKRRYKGHISKLNKNIHKNKKLQNAWNKYGSDNFIFSIIEEVECNLLEREQYYIDKFKSYDKSIGYNVLKDVGFTWSGMSHSKSTINKMKKCKIGNKNPMYGRGRTINQLDKNGVFIRSFVSVTEAAKFLKLKFKIVKKKNRGERKVYTPTPIRKCLNGLKPSAYGYKWEYPV